MPDVQDSEWDAFFNNEVEEVWRDDEVRGEHWAYLVKFTHRITGVIMIRVYIGKGQDGEFYVEPLVRSNLSSVPMTQATPNGVPSFDQMSLKAIRLVRVHRNLDRLRTAIATPEPPIVYQRVAREILTPPRG